MTSHGSDIDRTAEWGWDDTPARARVFGADLPPIPEPLPKALDDGSAARVAYAGTNGRPYTAIGRTLIAQGELERGQVSLQTIHALTLRAYWLMSGR